MRRVLDKRFSVQLRIQFFNATIYLGFSIASSLLGMAAVLMLTRLLSPEQYGTIGVFYSLLFLIVPLISLCCEGLIAVSKTTLQPGDYELFQRNCLGLAYFSFAVMQVLLIGLWCGGLLGSGLLVFAPLFALIRFIAGMAGTEYIVEQRPIMYGTLTLVTAVIALGLTVLLTEGFGAWGGFRVLALLVADVLVLGVRYRGRMNILFTPTISSAHRKQILAYGIPSLICIPGAWGMNEADKMIVAKIAGIDAAGIYVAGAGLAVIMTTFLQSLTNALYPGMFRTLAAKKLRPMKVLVQYTGGFMLGSLLFCGLVLVGYFWIGDRILPPRYLGAKPIFVALMCAGVANSIYRPFGLAADYFRLARLRAVAILLGGLTTISVGFIGVTYSGPLWAAGGVAAGYLIAAVTMGVGIIYSRGFDELS